MLTITMDEGEYKRIEWDYTGSEYPWDDLTGCMVEMFGRYKITDTGTPPINVIGAVGAPNPDGKITIWGADVPLNTPAGTYEVTMLLSRGEDEGFPQIETCRLIIQKHA